MNSSSINFPNTQELRGLRSRSSSLPSTSLIPKNHARTYSPSAHLSAIRENLLRFKEQQQQQNLNVIENNLYYNNNDYIYVLWERRDHINIKGKPPLPRYGHTFTKIKNSQLFITFGGQGKIGINDDNIKNDKNKMRYSNVSISGILGYQKSLFYDDNNDDNPNDNSKTVEFGDTFILTEN